MSERIDPEIKKLVIWRIETISIIYEEFLNRQYKKLGEKNKFKKMVF